LTALQAPPPPTRTQFTSLLDQELQANRARAQRLYQEATQRNPISSNLQTGTRQASRINDIEMARLANKYNAIGDLMSRQKECN